MTVGSDNPFPSILLVPGPQPAAPTGRYRLFVDEADTVLKLVDDDGTVDVVGSDTAAIAAHQADTTAIHGIADTSALVLTGDARLSDPRTPVAHAHVDADLPAGLARDSEVTTAVGAEATARDAAIAAHAALADPHPTYTTAAELAAFAQPLDSDLTAIAALSTTAYGRAFLALADAAAGRTALGLGTAALSATGDFDAAGAAAAAQAAAIAASQPLDADLTAIAALTTTSYGRSVLATANAAALRTLAGVEVARFGINIGPPSNLFCNSATTISANSAWYSSFDVSRPVTVTTVWFAITVASGNLDFGIYDDSGARLGSTGTFACPAAGGRSRALTGSVVLVPGVRYWAAYAADNAAVTALRYVRVVYPLVTGYGLAGTNGSSFPLSTSLALNDGALTSFYIAFS
jgi:hypothetical protein